MIKIFFYNPKKYHLDKTLIKNSIFNVLKKNHISNNAEASIAIVNAKKMSEYAKKYLNETEDVASSHPVLSFLKSEVQKPFVEPPDQINHIGEIIISYDKAVEYSQKSGKTISQEIAALAEHATLHLCGIHHN